MSFRKDISVTIFGWTFGVGFSFGWLVFQAAWETSPPGYFLTLPFLSVWVEKVETDYKEEPWPWGWSMLRLTIWKTEFRLDLDLNIWGLGVTCIEFDDLGIYAGPFNVQIETDKMFDVDFPPGVPTLRLFFPAGRSVQPWPPGCGNDRTGGDIADDDMLDPAPADSTEESATDA